MTDKIDDGGPAFPDGQMFNGIAIHPGMSLRDYFAGQALAGLLADSANIQRHDTIANQNPAWNMRNVAAAFCYQYADAMLAGRVKGNVK